MFQDVVAVAGFSLVGWLLASVNITWLRPMPKKKRVALHYVGEILIFGGVFALYYQLVPSTMEVFGVILTCLLSLLVYELMAWKVYYGGVPWYYGFAHWWFPTYLIAGAIYLVFWLLGGAV